jgi:hypothetical protein
MKTLLKIIGTILVLIIAMVINGVTLKLTETRLFGMLALVVAFVLIRRIWRKKEVSEVIEAIVPLRAVKVASEKRAKKQPARTPERKSTLNAEKFEGLEALSNIELPVFPNEESVSKPVVLAPKKEKRKEILPPPMVETSEAGETAFVRYTVDYSDVLEDFPDDGYPVVRYPQKGTVIRSHRLGSTKRRGFKDADFEVAIRAFLPNTFTVIGNARLNTGKDTRPYEPDVAIIGHGIFSDLRIDVEIDEPYAGITRQATHCKGDDLNRDIYFQDRGWIVLRFAEIQVHQQLRACLFKILSTVRKTRDSDELPGSLESLITDNRLRFVSSWDTVKAQKWEQKRYRESYLNHEFGLVESEPETVKRDLNAQEIEEEALVEATVNEQEAGVGTESFNGRNRHPRDSRLKFYPEEHLYTLDGVPITAASNLIARFFPEFDAKYWSKRKASREGMSAKKLRKKWARSGQESRDLGTKLHEDIENYYLNGVHAEGIDYELFQDFLADHPDLRPYRSEWRIFDEKYMVAGTLDLVVKTATGYDMYDWKRSKKVVDIDGSPITTNQWADGIGPLSHLPDTSFNRYALQQNIYRSFLKKHYGIKIDTMYLVVLHPYNGTYYKVKVPKRKEEVKALLGAVR